MFEYSDNTYGIAADYTSSCGLDVVDQWLLPSCANCTEFDPTDILMGGNLDMEMEHRSSECMHNLLIWSLLICFRVGETLFVGVVRLP